MSKPRLTQRTFRVVVDGKVTERPCYPVKDADGIIAITIVSLGGPRRTHCVTHSSGLHCIVGVTRKVATVYATVLVDTLIRSGNLHLLRTGEEVPSRAAVDGIRDAHRVAKAAAFGGAT